MDSSVACPALNTFSADNAEPRPEKLHHCGRRFGLLSSIQPAEDCQIAQIGERLVVLPLDLDLSAHIGYRIGLIRIDDRYLVRRITA